jgi:plasmid rolling circle replication initiator protein Rep
MVNKIKSDKQIKNIAITDANGNYFALQDGRANWKERKSYGVNWANILYMLGSEDLSIAKKNGSLRIDEKTGEVFVDSEIAKKYFSRSNRMTDCGLRLEYKVDVDGVKRLHNANFCRDRLCPICMWRLSRRLAWETNLIMSKYTAENPDMIPILISLTVKNPRMGELSQMLDVLCDGDKGAWQILRKWFARRGIKDYVRTLEVTFNGKSQTWHPHFHILTFAPKDYFRKGNKNYISHSLLGKEWQHACKLDYTPIVDIRRCYDKNAGANERIDFDSNLKTVSFTGAVKETAKYCVKPLNLFADEFNDYDDYADSDGNTGKLNIKAVVRELAEALAGRRLRSLGGKIKTIAKELKLDDDESKKDLIHKDENGTAEAIWQEVYEYVFSDKDYYLTAREEVAQTQNDAGDSIHSEDFGKSTPLSNFQISADADVGRQRDSGVPLPNRYRGFAEIRGAEFSKNAVVGKPINKGVNRFEGVEGLALASSIFSM